MHLAQQPRADAAAPRACPDVAAGPEKPGVIFLVRCTGPAERGSDGARDLVSLDRHPASEFDHWVCRPDFPPGLGVIENGLVRPELVGDGASRLVKGRPEFIADGVRVEGNDTDDHHFLSGFPTKRTLMSKGRRAGRRRYRGASLIVVVSASRCPAPRNCVRCRSRGEPSPPAAGLRLPPDREI